MSPAVHTFDLASGVKIPWLGWGNGSGDASKVPVEGGVIALKANIRHIDTAQIYLNEGSFDHCSLLSIHSNSYNKLLPGKL